MFKIDSFWKLSLLKIILWRPLLSQHFWNVLSISSKSVVDILNDNISITFNIPSVFLWYSINIIRYSVSICFFIGIQFFLISYIFDIEAICLKYFDIFHNLHFSLYGLFCYYIDIFIIYRKANFLNFDIFVEFFKIFNLFSQLLFVCFIRVYLIYRYLLLIEKQCSWNLSVFFHN